MNELERAYAALGKLQTQFDDLNKNYSNLLCFLGSVVSGEVERSRVLVNLTDRTYAWAAPGETPAMPCTINGLPVVIVAKPDESSGGKVEIPPDATGDATITGA